MPLAIAALIRILIQATVQVGIFIGLDKLLGPLTDAAKKQVADLFNMTDEEAQDSIANEVIDAFAMIGIIGVSIKTKIPTIVAEKLGFTSRGYAKRQISAKLPTGVPGATAKIVTATTAKVILTEAEATIAVAKMKTGNLGFAKYYALAIGTLGVIQLAMMNIGNWIDFGNWNSGAYQKSMQKFIAWITFGNLVPDEDYRKSKTASEDVFTKVYNTYKLGGANGISDPYKAQSVPFTRDNLLDLIDQAGATLLLATGKASTKEVLVATLPMISFDTSVQVDSLLGVRATTPSITTATAPTIQIPKVFTGIVSQGVVGAGLVFTARPDDLIESIEELKTAAANNLTPYLATLAGKIVYEVKIVSSVISKDGFRQSGTTQKIQSGKFANGTPKYKTVTNKFATLVVYALTDKGSRAKLTTIVLGPTDSAKLTVQQNDITALEKELPSIVTTTNIALVSNINTPTPTQTVDKELPYTIYKFMTNNQPSFQALVSSNVPYGASVANLVEARLWFQSNPTALAQQRLLPNFDKILAGGIVGAGLEWKTDPISGAPVLVPSAVPVVSQPVTTSPKAGANATTLSEWYTAQGQELPKVAERATPYERLGLGQATYYTGTAEQNTKLLAALKA